MQFKLVIPKTIHQQKNLFDFGFYDTNSIVNIVITLPYFVGLIVIKRKMFLAIRNLASLYHGGGKKDEEFEC